jgi:hypothetical protein
MLMAVCLLPACLHAQTRKEINHQLQSWFSVNSTIRFTDKWGMIGDFHIRRNDFVRDPSFYFLRLGPNFWLKNNMSISAGYAHLWLAPSTEGFKTWANENRLYQQFVVSTKMGKNSVLQRIRNEQRWQEKVVNDVKTGEIRFTNRVRYLASFTFPIFENPKAPSLVLADEILLHFGKEVVYNTFEQNRIFLGIRENLGSGWSFDFGYMNVYQQKYSGYQYDMNHTIRLFFYYNGGRKPGRHADIPAHHDE